MKSLKWHYFGNKGANYFIIHENFDSDVKRLCVSVCEANLKNHLKKIMFSIVEALLLSGRTD